MKSRKELQAEYRERKAPMGVFGIRNTANGKLFIDKSLDMPALWNRHRFQLDFGNHPNARLQADWKAQGPENFRFEVLADLKPREEGKPDYRKELEALEELCLEQWKPYGPAGYHEET